MTVAQRRNNAAGVAGQPPVDVSVGDSALRDDLAERLEELAPHRGATRITYALVGLLVLIAGFIGGVLVQRNLATASPTAAPANLPDFGAGAGGQPPAQEPSDPTTTTGTVTLVDGITIYVTLPNGEIATIKTTDTTSITLQQSAVLTDLTTGQTVTVDGTADAEGIITAINVTADK